MYGTHSQDTFSVILFLWESLEMEHIIYLHYSMLQKLSSYWVTPSLCVSPCNPLSFYPVNKSSLCSVQHTSILCSLCAKREHLHLSALEFCYICSSVCLYHHTLCHFPLAIHMRVTIASSIKGLLFILFFFLLYILSHFV